MDLTNDEIEILKDMIDEWADKDRHGELEREWGYDSGQLEASASLYQKVTGEAKRRGFWWAR